MDRRREGHVKPTTQSKTKIVWDPGASAEKARPKSTRARLNVTWRAKARATGRPTSVLNGGRYFGPPLDADLVHKWYFVSGLREKLLPSEIRIASCTWWLPKVRTSEQSNMNDSLTPHGPLTSIGERDFWEGFRPLVCTVSGVSLFKCCLITSTSRFLTVNSNQTFWEVFAPWDADNGKPPFSLVLDWGSLLFGVFLRFQVKQRTIKAIETTDHQKSNTK